MLRSEQILPALAENIRKGEYCGGTFYMREICPACAGEGRLDDTFHDDEVCPRCSGERILCRVIIITDVSQPLSQGWPVKE